MKTKLYLSLLLSFAFYILSSQVPQGFNYQAIVRNTDGDVLQSKLLKVTVAIKTALTGGTVFWEEYHNVTSNQFGLVSFAVGSGTYVSGTITSFNLIDWKVQPLYLKTSVEYPVGTVTEMGTAQILSVPYSLVAKDLEGPIDKLLVRGKTLIGDDALFEIKNREGESVFAVYNEGIRAYVKMNDTGARGGFQISGSNSVKGGRPQNLMTISPDSIRFNINNVIGKGAKGGFAVGGFDMSKGSSINQDFMYITPVESGNGQFNTFLGWHSGYSNVTGNSNIFIGYQAGYTNYGPTTLNPTYGLKNIYLGAFTGEKNLGSYNVLIGDSSAIILNEGSSNVMIGRGTGKSLINGNYNTYLGAFAGQLETGSDNVMIGYKSGSGSGGSDLLVIGNRNNTSGLITGYFTPAKLFLWADVGINNNSPTEKLDVNGNARFRSIGSGAYVGAVNRTSDGTLTTATSDIRSKDNINTLTNSLNTILNLRGITFTWKNEPEMGRRIGFIAQEVEPILPELVFTNPADGLKGVNYAEMTAVIVEAMKEQQQQIESQQKEIEELKALVNSLIANKTAQVNN